MTNLTKEIREDIALTLTIKAVRRSADRLATDLAKLNDAYWAMHKRRVSSRLGIPEDKWPGLMQDNVVNNTTQISPVYVGERDSRVSFLKFYGRRDETMARRLLTDARLRGIGRWFERRYGDMNFYFKANTSVPYMRDMDVLADERPTKALARRMQGVAERLHELIAAAEKFHADVSLVLASCRTVKQLENILPEAAKLVPAKPKESTALAPVDLAKSVERMLEKGVPPHQDL